MRHLLIAILIFTLSSCRFWGMGEKISGNGNIISQDRTAGNFNSLQVSGQVTVKIRQGNTHAVKMETDENLMNYIEVFTEGNTLIIRTKEGYHLHPSKDVIASITAPAFHDIDVSGACDILSEGTISGTAPLNLSISGSGNLDADVELSEVTATISGSGTANLKGRAQKFTANISGSGEIKCYDLLTQQAKLNISGSGDAQVNVSQQLDVRVSGAGNVRYKGSPRITQDISGAGDIEKAD